MPTDDGFSEWYKEVDDSNWWDEKDMAEAAWHAAVKHERERAARVAHNEADKFGATPDSIAAAIRGGGE